jgi:hypothetical protein
LRLNPLSIVDRGGFYRDKGSVTGVAGHFLPDPFAGDGGSYSNSKLGRYHNEVN